MSNFKHYVRELMNGNSFFSVKLIYKYSIVMLAVLHAVNALLYLLGGSYIFMVVNAIVAALCITIILPMVDRGNLIGVYLISLCEIIAIVFVTSLFIGWEAGLTSYLFACVTSAFYFSFVNRDKEGSHHALPLVLTILIILCYFIDYAIMQFIPPFIGLKNTVMLTVIYVFNTVAAFAIMVIFSYLFVWELANKQRVLTEQNEKLEELAHKDPLTKLLNRRSMNDILAERMELLRKSGKRFTMVLGDIDDFKKVNDTYGHDAGDLVLVTVANTIVSSVGAEDAVCRWGGEEILILVTYPMEMAAVTAENIRKNVEGNVVHFEDKEIHITMTFGIAESIPGYKLEHLIQQADDKLYYGKKHGKNQVVTDLKND